MKHLTKWLVMLLALAMVAAACAQGDDGDAGDDTNEFPPYKSGDTIRVEMHSMSVEAFEFMNEALNQMTLSDATIFAPPLVNVPTVQVPGPLV